RSHVLRVDVLRPDDTRPAPGDPDFIPPVHLEPHNLVLWAGRWYLVAHREPDLALPAYDSICGTNEHPRKVPQAPTQPVRKGRSHDLGWEVLRVDRLHVHSPTGIPFTRRELPCDNLAEYVRTRYSRGDVPASWQCTGVVLIDLPADLVARWAPGGSVVEYVAENRTRLTVGAWSWAGIAGILATFDAHFTVVEPTELTDACHEIARRLAHARRLTHARN
ncbi:helix-turn-helix transcriptional regulator, partial [Kibdelosporangium lantanae]